MINNIVTINACVHRGPLLQSKATCLCKKTHKTKAYLMLLFKNFLILSSKIHYGCHVHLVKSGKHGCSVFCLYKSATNCSSQVAHFLSPFVATEKFFADCPTRIHQRLKNIMLHNSPVRSGRSN